MSQQATERGYSFTRGYPTDETTRRAYDEADLERAIQAYKFFYPTVSGAAIIKGNEQIGVIPNKVFGVGRVRRPALRPAAAGRPSRTLDQDSARQGLVRLLPDLWPGGGALRRELAAGDFERIAS